MNRPAAAGPTVLIGFMGAGKTTVGQALATRLGRGFIDLDRLVEAESGRSVHELLLDGAVDPSETPFRRLESKALRHALATRNTVIAAGGGAVLAERSQEALREAGGEVVWLRVSPGVALARTRAHSDTQRRPLLPPTPGEVAALLAAREPAYRAASTLTVDTDGRAPEAIASELAARMAPGAAEPQPAGASVITGDSLPPGHGPVVLGPGLLPDITALAGFPLEIRGPVIVVSEPLAYTLYGPAVCEAMRRAGLEVRTHLLPSGEQAKSLRQLDRLWRAMAASGLERGGLVVTLGGGAVTDAGGFAAATYARGVRVVHLPTTLLAQVDAAIGGKTALNLAGSRNGLGVFHFPDLVVVDTGTHRTLPPDLLADGLVEAAKTLLVGGVPPEEVSALMAAAGGLPLLVRQAASVKARIVAADPLDHHSRETLNLGHTFGHALEAALGFRGLRHGMAVGAGLLAAARLSGDLGLLAGPQVTAIQNLLAPLLKLFPRSALKRLVALGPAAIIAHTAADKKRRNGRVRFIVLRSAGIRLEAVSVEVHSPEAPVRALDRALGDVSEAAYAGGATRPAREEIG